MIDLSKWKLYKCFPNEDIVLLQEHPDHRSDTYNESEEIGKHFTWVTDEYDNTLSFVYDGWSNSTGTIWKLIWKG